MFEPCPTCGGSGFYFRHIRPTDGPSEPCPDCEGRGRVVSESVIGEMGEAIYNRDDAYPEKWEYQTEDVKDWYRDKARAAARVVLEHMEDNERTTG